MLDINFQKQELRKIFKQKRSALTKEEVQTKSATINKNFIDNLLPQLLEKKSEKNFSLYLASRGEVLTDEIAKHFKNQKIIFSYPRIIDKNQPLDFILHEDQQIFTPNSTYPSILEPSSIYNKKIIPDFIIMPLVAFDQEMSRLGMGGGFFDRSINFLKKQNSQIITIGLAYDFQRSNTLLPIANTDWKLDFIVTEKMIFSAS